MHRPIRPTARALDLGVPAMADDDNLAAATAIALRLPMDFAHRRAGRIDDP